MDAREYMARKGLDAGRDQERPNTLEEKAWSRAIEAGEQPPRAGTPFDWEDWERHHETLAEGAETLEQKIDHEAHRRALDHEASVGHFTPAAGERVTADDKPAGTATRDTSDAGDAPPAGGGPAPRDPAVPPAPAPRAALYALAVLLPPLAVGLSAGGAMRVVLGLALSLLGWLPGVVYALWWLRRSSP
ncbi:Proteolipid membrane potential modulator [Halomonas sp. THAF5a]|uniref:YqaE/Pmp3 family membrane protein n=1 Tax=Halomonas sp. THAF5a TaxID=2587844 RepID=UPI001269415A|nr:YqaE/Pmp3 family membrane protein [Halomonas sp. THAF5a]QFU02385.1 Proteolipid membrane potential modulator [Halomonas sp. THAF5a]